MKWILFILGMILAAQIHAAESASILESPTPVATAEPTPETDEVKELLHAPWDEVELKDGQRTKGKIRGYDKFFLEFSIRNATRLHIPWNEVAEVSPAEFTGDTAIMRQYMSRDRVSVTTKMVAKSPARAFGKAVWPGILIHGYGYKEAGNSDMFLSLAGAELFGVLVGGFGATRTTDPGLSKGERETANSMVIGGAAIFALSWIVDLVGAGFSAQSYNRRNRLEFGLSTREGDPALTAHLRF